MCEYFVKADPILYEQRTRAIRIHGVLTSIRLENMVWDILAEMADAEGCTTNGLIVQFHDEILAHRGEVPNFASFLRVTGMRFLRRQLIGAEAPLPKGEIESAGPNVTPRARPRAVPHTAWQSASQPVTPPVTPAATQTASRVVPLAARS